MFKKIKIKITVKKIVSWSYFAIILACLFLFYNICQFFNKNIYQTVIQPEDVSASEITTANETIKININKFNDIVEEINKKTAPREANGP
ncbi:hypothetical protein KJ586_02930, partial [Patescibacteria group bacterium]|nr:hypothetical protein [Patescibacteria group bacterium]